MLQAIFKLVRNFDVAVHVDGNVVKMLVGNKSDLAHIREVPVEDGKKLAKSEELFFIETSALDNTNVLSAFQIVVKEIYTNVSKKMLNSDSYKSQLSLNRVNIMDVYGDGDGVEPPKTEFLLLRIQRKSSFVSGLLEYYLLHMTFC